MRNAEEVTPALRNPRPDYYETDEQAWQRYPQPDSGEDLAETRSLQEQIRDQFEAEQPFEYAISRGLGILACRRRQGRRYEVFPVHWPLRNQPDPVEQDWFLERYRDQFEEAGILEPQSKRRLPRLR